MPARPLLAAPPLAAPAVARPAAFPQGAARHRLPIVAPPPGPVPPARQVPSLDLTRYLVRLEDLLVRVVSGETGPSVARELGDLLGDLRSVDAPEPLVTVVDRLLAEVRAGQSVPAESVAAVREAIVAARLPAPGPDQAGPAAGTRRRGRRFWR
jgi:hypothetical protein